MSSKFSAIGLLSLQDSFCVSDARLSTVPPDAAGDLVSGARSRGKHLAGTLFHLYISNPCNVCTTVYH